MFHDRSAAGEMLAEAVAHRVAGQRCRVYGLARGGVVVAHPVAEWLGAPLDVLIACKVGAPGQPEYAVGAVAEGNGTYWDDEALKALVLDRVWCERAGQDVAAEVARRTLRYRDHPLEVEPGVLSIVVDDGIATGSTVMAGLRGLVGLGATRRAVAAPVISHEAMGLLRGEAEWVVALESPEPFMAVGAHYARFDPVDDQELLRALGRAA